MEKKRYSLKERENKALFIRGMRNGLPIGLGYLAVSFSLGIAARSAGLSAAQGFLVSLLCNASAGEYVGFTIIAAGASYIEMAIATFIANMRYLLMSGALSQRMAPGTSLLHRLVIGFDITDEVFGITIARPGFVNPVYTYGAMVTSIPFWATGTALGVIAGNLLPVRLVSAFSVALYGMFLAVIIPPARKDKVIMAIVPICFAASFAATKIPFVSGLADGTRTIILTVIIAAAAALLFPRNEGEEAEE